MGVRAAFKPLIWVLGAAIPMVVAVLLPSRLSAASAQASKDPKKEGQALFVSKCATCHGQNGQGGAGYRSPLRGTLSVGQLGEFIASSMPPGSKHCPAPQASKIAAYIYDGFYSPLAQERNRPARVELSRLTVRQFRNAVTDLVSGFHPAVPNSAVHGLKAEYFKGRGRNSASRVIERIDPDVRFQFGTDPPAKTGFDAKNFSIQWTGSVLAPDTGDYEFSLSSRHSCQMWINGSRYPVVDGEVRSAGDPDPKGTITLLGGRAYPITLVFTKATQGVNDADKKNPKPSMEAHMVLQWQRPNHVTEPIPTQFLYPDDSPRTYVGTSPFPADDRSAGYERGNSVSKDWDEATTTAALEAGTYVAKNPAEVTGVPDNDKDRVAHLKGYCADFVQRAFRRPLTPALKQLYIEKQFAAASSPETAVKRVIVLALKSPRFLYREITPGARDGYFVASQLSFGLWDTIPDQTLLEAAAKGQLATRDQVVAQAQRMTGDNRAWSKLRQFLLLWLKVDEPPEIVKSRRLYPNFDSSAASDLRTSLELFLQNTAWSGASDYRDLMTSDKEFLNGRLAQLYGLSLPADAPFQEVTLDSGERAGVITQPYLLSRFAYLDGSSPIHRGVLIVRNLLGRTLSQPPSNFVPLAASAHPDLTTRERVALQTKPTFCNNCHGIINPLGYTLEEFDAVGRLRSADNNKPVDASGSYRARNGVLVKFSNAKDLAQYLARSDDAQGAFVEKLFLNVAKQAPLAYGPNELANLEHGFAGKGYSIRSLLVDMVTSIAMPDNSSSRRSGAATQ
jgi:hypothetical protein